jgi:hypothetical protein
LRLLFLERPAENNQHEDHENEDNQSPFYTQCSCLLLMERSQPIPVDVAAMIAERLVAHGGKNAIGFGARNFSPTTDSNIRNIAPSGSRQSLLRRMD